MKKLLITVLLSLFSFYMYSQVKVGMELALQHTFTKSVEAKAYATMTVCDIVKGEWGMGMISNGRIIEPVLFIKNKFRLVEQDGFSFYIVPFWFYGYLTESRGRDIFNSVEFDYRHKSWILTLGMDWNWTKNYDNYNNDVGINLTIKKILFNNGNKNS